MTRQRQLTSGSANALGATRELVDPNFTVAITTTHSPGGYQIQICCRNIWTREEIFFEYPQTSGFRNAVSTASATARTTFAHSAHDEFDVIACIVAHWAQYKDNLYGCSEDCGQKTASEIIFFLAYYVQAFSVEMCGFLKSLKADDRQRLLATINGGGSAEHPHYSEILEASEFYGLYSAAFEIN